MLMSAARVRATVDSCNRARITLPERQSIIQPGQRPGQRPWNNSLTRFCALKGQHKNLEIDRPGEAWELHPIHAVAIRVQTESSPDHVRVQSKRQGFLSHIRKEDDAYVGVTQPVGVGFLGRTRHAPTSNFGQENAAIRSIYGHKMHIARGHGPPNVG